MLCCIVQCSCFNMNLNPFGDKKKIPILHFLYSSSYLALHWYFRFDNTSKPLFLICETETETDDSRRKQKKTNFPLFWTTEHWARNIKHGMERILLTFYWRNERQKFHCTKLIVMGKVLTIYLLHSSQIHILTFVKQSFDFMFWIFWGEGRA